MSQVRSRNALLQPNAGDALPMGAFRPHLSWYEEYWLTEVRPAPPSVIRQCLARLAALPGVFVKLRRLIAERSTVHTMPVPGGAGRSLRRCSPNRAATYPCVPLPLAAHSGSQIGTVAPDVHGGTRGEFERKADIIPAPLLCTDYVLQ